MTDRVLLDFRAGVRWAPRSLQVHATAVEAAWADPGHPSSEGRRAATWLDAARSTVTALTGFRHVAFLPDRDTALRAWAHDRVTVTSTTHRRAVLAWADHTVPVDADGRAQWPSAVGERALLAQAANEETGVVDTVPEGAVIALDATQTFARAPLPYAAEVVVVDARAWGSPADVAMLLSMRPLEVRDHVQVPAAVVAVDALTAAWQDMPARTAAEALAMSRFEQQVRAAVPDVQFHGSHRVPHIRSLSVLHLDAETLMRALDAEGYVVGSGSACVQDGTPSHVLAAMGRVTHGNLRIALPVDVDPDVLDGFAVTLARTVARLREEAGVADL